MNSRRVVIGLTGPVGSGVSTVGTSLQRSGFAVYKVSDPIKEELRKREGLSQGVAISEGSMPDFRKKLQDIGNEGRRENLSHWIDKIQIGDGDIVIDGIRNFGEVKSLRQRFREFYLIAVLASPKERWERIQDAYNKDYGLFERDQLRDSSEESPEGQHVAVCVQQADYVLINGNDGTSSEARFNRLQQGLAYDIELMRDADELGGGKPGRPPTPEEVHMATAFSQSHMSRCVKRHVGAVIVDGNNFPLSVGYNENPLGVKPCINGFQCCFKDENMLRKLEKMANIYCPICGVKSQNIKAPWRCTNPDCREDLKSLFFPSRNMELCTAIHAEERAIRSLYGRSADGATMYTTTYPCFQCARYVVEAGIKRVVYVEAYPVNESQEFMTQNGVVVEPFQGFKARAFNRVFKQVL